MATEDIFTNVTSVQELLYVAIGAGGGCWKKNPPLSEYDSKLAVRVGRAAYARYLELKTAVDSE